MANFNDIYMSNLPKAKAKIGTVGTNGKKVKSHIAVNVNANDMVRTNVISKVDTKEMYTLFADKKANLLKLAVDAGFWIDVQKSGEPLPPRDT